MRHALSLKATAAAGALIGLGVFAAEAAWILEENAIGLDIDLSGPFAALMEVVRPMVPPLLAKIALAYAVAGALGGLYAAALVNLWRLRRAWVARAVWLIEFAVIAALLIVDHAIVRPALFDDLRWAQPLLAWLVDHGDPFWVRVCAAVFVGGQLLGAAVTNRIWRARVVGWSPFIAKSSALALAALTPWTSTFSAPVQAERSDAVVGAAPSTLAPRAGAQGERPALILLIGVDAFRPDRIGRGIAPNLEAFLSDATLFTNAWTPIGQTEPAWRSIVTARWPSRTGLRYPLAAESRWVPAQTFPALLTGRGLRTSFATDCSRFNFQTEDSGFTARLQPPRGAVNFVLEKLRFRMLGVVADNGLGAKLVPELIDNRALAGIHDPAGYAERLAGRIVDEASAGPSLFAFHGTAAHFPGDPVLPFYRRYVPKTAPIARRLRMFFSPIAQGGTHPGRWGRAESEALYDELLAQGDAQVGTLFGALRDADLYDESAIIVFSDHGESFHADHPELAGATPVHGARISEEENRILFAVKLPRSRASLAPRTSNALVRLIDIGPTVLELAGAAQLPDSDGVSLLPILEGKTAPPLRLYAETGFTHAAPGVFDPAHLSVAPRTFDIYRVRADGVVEITDAAHEASLREKDVAAFDGVSWIVRSPRADGSIAETCEGACPADSLRVWLDAQAGARGEVSARLRVGPPSP